MGKNLMLNHSYLEESTPFDVKNAKLLNSINLRSTVRV